MKIHFFSTYFLILFEILSTAVRQYAEDKNESQLNSTLIQILQEVVSSLEEEHLKGLSSSRQPKPKI